MVPRTRDGFESRPVRKRLSVLRAFFVCTQKNLAMYFTYILQSEVDKSFYIGYTSDLQKRLSGHNAGMSRYTSKKAPWKIVYFESFETKSEAIKRELFLKRQKSRELLIRLIEGSSVG